MHLINLGTCYMHYAIYCKYIFGPALFIYILLVPAIWNTVHNCFFFFLVSKQGYNFYTYFQFVAFPFGLSSAPRVSKLVLALLVLLGSQVTGYLDDLLNDPFPSQNILSDYSDTSGFCLGDQLSNSCSPNFPSPGILGLHSTHSTSTSLSSRKETSLSDLMLRPYQRPPCKISMRVLGFMIFSFQAVQFAHSLHSRPLPTQYPVGMEPMFAPSQPLYASRKPSREYSCLMDFQASLKWEVVSTLPMEADNKCQPFRLGRSVPISQFR